MAACVLERGADPACGWREGLTYCCLDSERQGTCYFEFQRGRNPGRFWRTSSIYMEDEVFDRLNLPELFAGALPDFDYYGETEVTPEQWDRIKTGAGRMGPQTRAAISELDGWAQDCFCTGACFPGCWGFENKIPVSPGNDGAGKGEGHAFFRYSAGL